MLVSLTSRDIYDWDFNQRVYVYSADKKCLTLCKGEDLNLFHNPRNVRLEPVDNNLQVCPPKLRESPPNCVGRQCLYPETCYPYETEKQNYECTF
jgi:hypothetical protein